MHKFKVGDRVRVVERAYSGTLQAGYTGTITREEVHGECVQVDDVITGHFYGYSGGKLELVAEQRAVKGYIFKTHIAGYYGNLGEGHCRPKERAHVYDIDTILDNLKDATGWGSKRDGKWRLVYA